jgi:hypothetical protein
VLQREIHAAYVEHVAGDEVGFSRRRIDPDRGKP